MQDYYYEKILRFRVFTKYKNVPNCEWRLHSSFDNMQSAEREKHSIQNGNFEDAKVTVSDHEHIVKVPIWM